MELSLLMLDKIYLHCPTDRMLEYLNGMNAAFQEFEINSINRMAAWLGQVGVESGELRYTEEVWGPSPQQARYEPPSSLAMRLGNTKKGDGYLFRGRGPIELTGRSNYARVGKALGVDLEGNPDLAATPDVMFRVAGYYWKTHGCNELADNCNFDAITQKINGGLTDNDRRWLYYRLALAVLTANPND